MNNELISIIVPVYNVEKYLRRCLESIINQTYDNLEIILIDDGSTDNSLLICKEYQSIDDRIKVISQENKGLSSARNVGIRHCNGQIVSFIDSDDWIDKHFIDVLYTQLKNYDAQIVECKVKKITNYEKNDDYLNNKIANTLVFENENCFYQFLIGKYFRQVVWNKLYKKEVINRIFFEEGKTHEDEFWTYQIFANAKKIVFIDFEGYYYFQRTGSITNKKFSEENLHGFEAKKNRFDFVKEKYPEFIQINILDYLISCIYFYNNVFNSNISKKAKILKEIENEYKMALLLLDFDRINLRKKIWFYTFRFFPKLYCKINDMLQIV